MLIVKRVNAGRGEYIVTLDTAYLPHWAAEAFKGLKGQQPLLLHLTVGLPREAVTVVKCDGFEEHPIVTLSPQVQVWRGNMAVSSNGRIWMVVEVKT